MAPPQIHFRLSADDSFEQQLEEAIKTLRHGTKSVFFVNLSKALFGAMGAEQMKRAMVGIVQASPEVMANLFSQAVARLEAGETLFRREPVMKLAASNDVACEPSLARKKRHMKLRALCDDD